MARGLPSESNCIFHHALMQLRYQPCTCPFLLLVGPVFRGVACAVHTVSTADEQLFPCGACLWVKPCFVLGSQDKRMNRGAYVQQAPSTRGFIASLCGRAMQQLAGHRDDVMSCAHAPQQLLGNRAGHVGGNASGVCI